ncbi:hypothetical protein KAJ87_02280 [Candidatus Pacearchaeota archaeon]|nr:hypothetical protein [Candidatus Pacearchaeota archaeon]
MELEKQLPDTKYIRSFKKKHTEGNTEIKLSMGLPNFLGKGGELKEILTENNIPINGLYKPLINDDTIIYEGESNKLGSYKLTTKRGFSVAEKIILEATKEGEEIGKMPNLVKVLKDYSILYEKEIKKKMRSDKINAHLHSPTL